MAVAILFLAVSLILTFYRANILNKIKVLEATISANDNSTASVLARGNRHDAMMKVEVISLFLFTTVGCAGIAGLVAFGNWMALK